MSFNIGDKVKIRITSKFYRPENSRQCANPPNVMGIITDIKGGALPICVQWPNGRINRYNESDLMLIKKDTARRGGSKLEFRFV